MSVKYAITGSEGPIKVMYDEMTEDTWILVDNSFWDLHPVCQKDMVSDLKACFEKFYEELFELDEEIYGCPE